MQIDRHFFAQLTYSFTRLAANVHQRDIRVFSEEEIANEPLKWLKRLLMARVGLILNEDLNNEIRRYSMSDLRHAQEECRQALEVRSAKTSPGRSLIVVKAVGMNDLIGIRNFRILSDSEIDASFDEIASLYGETDRQLWFCVSLVDTTTLSVGGRISMPEGENPEDIELIWYTSPRRIDDYSGSDFEFPFWRAKRQLGQLVFRTDLLHVPTSYLTKSGRTLADYEREARYVLQQVRYAAPAMRRLSSIVCAREPYNIGEVTFEFKVEAGELLFIDWDSNN